MSPCLSHLISIILTENVYHPEDDNLLTAWKFLPKETYIYSGFNIQLRNVLIYFVNPDFWEFSILSRERG